MKKCTFLAIAMIAALLLPMAARAADPTLNLSTSGRYSPITVSTCSLMFGATNLASQIKGVQISFTNESALVADLVVFRVKINGAESLIRDVGTFSPGVAIVHDYRTAQGQFVLPSVLSQLFGRPSITCDVDSARFVGGKIWTRGAAQAMNSTDAGSASPIQVLPRVLNFENINPNAARDVLAVEGPGAQLSMSANCGQIAKIVISSQSDRDLSLRVTPIGPGGCTITITDAAGNIATVPVNVSGS